RSSLVPNSNRWPAFKRCVDCHNSCKSDVMSQIILHPYQHQLKNDVYSGWQNNQRNMLAVLPTGGGKSIVVSDIALDANNMGMRQAIIAHRNELVSQMSHHIARRGIYHRIIG